MYVKPLIGGVIVGCIGIKLPQVFGVGYSTVDNVLSTSLPFVLLFALFFAKLSCHSVTLGSGGSFGLYGVTSHSQSLSTASTVRWQ